MFGIGSGEMLVFAVVVLIALGPKRLPDFMRTVGKGLREIRRATSDLRKHSGIDELMRDDPAGLRALSRDISRAPAPRREQKLSAADLAKESPIEGVDIAHAHYLAKKNAAAAAASAAAATTAGVSMAPTVPIEPAEGHEPAPDTSSGFEGDTVPDKATEAGPSVRHEPTMMGIPAVDPYAPVQRDSGKTMAGLPALDKDGKAKSVPPPATKSAPPPPVKRRTSVPPPPPARAKTSVPPPPPTPKAASKLPPAGPKRSVPPPPPPPRIAPNEASSGTRRASLPPSIPPPSSPPPANEAEAKEEEVETTASDAGAEETATADKPNAREATMALEVEDLTLMDES